MNKMIHLDSVAITLAWFYLGILFYLKNIGCTGRGHAVVNACIVNRYVLTSDDLDDFLSNQAAHE